MPCISWHDEHKKVFKIRWVDKKKKKMFCEDDSKLFKEWAMLKKIDSSNDTRNKEIVHTGLFTLKDIDLEGGFMTSRFDTQLWDISET